MYGYVDMTMATLIIIRAKDWGQSIIGYAANGTFTVLTRHNTYYDLNIDSGGVITDTVSNTLYVSQFY